MPAGHAGRPFDRAQSAGVGLRGARRRRLGRARGSAGGAAGRARRSRRSGRRPLAAAAALPRAPLDLPGPTGESNRLSLHPRGQVLCLGAGPEAVLAQAILALAAGNAVLAVAEGAPATLAALEAVPADGRSTDGSTRQASATSTGSRSSRRPDPGLAAGAQEWR